MPLFPFTEQLEQKNQDTRNVFLVWEETGFVRRVSPPHPRERMRFGERCALAKPHPKRGGGAPPALEAASEKVGRTHGGSRGKTGKQKSPACRSVKVDNDIFLWYINYMQTFAR